MKRLLSFFVLFLLVSCSKEVTYDSLVSRNGIAYEVNSQTPYTGEVVKLFENGQLEKKASYLDGMMNGPFESYYENSQLEEKSIYKNGIIDGPYESYYKNGQLRTKGVIKNGSFTGEYDAYTFSGKKMLTGIDKIIEEYIAVEINGFKKFNSTCEDVFTNYDIKFLNSIFDDEYIEYFSEFVRGTNLKDELTDISVNHESNEELEIYVNFYLNRYKFSDYHWKKLFQHFSENQMQTLKSCNAGEDIILALNTFHINRDRLFENIFKPNEVSFINAENDVKQQIDDFFDYEFGITTAEECKEYPDCLKVFKVIYD